MRPIAKLLGLCAAALFTIAPSAPAQNLLGVDTFNTNLVEIDPAIPMIVNTTPLTLAGQTINRANGLARHPMTGVLYAIIQLTGVSGRDLVTVDEATGVCTSVGNTGHPLASITFTRKATLFAVSGSQGVAPETLYTLSLVDGSATFALTLGNGDDGEAIGYHWSNNEIYHASGMGNLNNLVTGQIFERISLDGVDTPTLSNQVFLNGASTNEIQGLVDNGRFGFYATDRDTDNLYTLTKGGTFTLLGSLGQNIRGLAYVRPANDNCENADVIVNGTWSGNLLGATADGSSWCSDSSPRSPDIWFSYRANNYGILTVNTEGTHDLFGVDTGVDSVLSVHSGCPGDLGNDLECDTVTATPGQMGIIRDAQVSVLLNYNDTVLIRVANQASGADSGSLVHTGPIVLNTSFEPLPAPNDDCTNATVISPNFSVINYDGSMATTDGMPSTGFCDHGSPNNDEQNYNDIWFSYTPAIGGCTLISTLSLVAYDTKLTVYESSSCPDDPSTIIACADDFVVPPESPFEAGLDVDLVAGTTYLIRLGTFAQGVPNRAGRFQISPGPGTTILTGDRNPGAPGCDAFLSFCSGDGGNGSGCTDCPCMNEAPAASIGGCLNSAGTGARLYGSGDTSVSLAPGITTDLRFSLTGAPPTAFCILNSGGFVAPGGMSNPCFGLSSGTQSVSFDGLRCAISNTRRHGGRSADVNGDVGVTNNPWGGEGGPPVGLAQAGPGFISGQTRFFQVINRDNAMLSCMRGLNTSQALKVTFTP